LTHALGLTVLSTVLLVRPHRLEPGRTANKLVRELGLVLLVVRVDIVDLVSGIITAVVLEEVKEAHFVCVK
jgi:hypothetical protein